MKTLTNTLGIGRQASKLLVFALLVAILITATAPVLTSEVYGAGETIHIRYIDYGGTVLKEGDVTPEAILDPPDNPSQDGMKFLGWDKYLGGHKTDTDINAVYELIMTTEKEEKGKLAKAGTANPPKDEVIVASSSEGSVTVDSEATTSEEAVTTPEIIKTEPIPQAVSDKDEGVSTTTITLSVLAAVIALALVGYIVFIMKRRKRNDTA